MQIFVTGGSGFVGRHLLRRLVASGHSVAALARPNIAYSRVKLATEQALSSADTPGMTLVIPSDGVFGHFAIWVDVDSFETVC